MRVLAYVNHFYGRATPFRGKSATQEPAPRRRVVESVCRALQGLPAETSIRVCGDGRHHLVSPDIVFPDLPDPRHLVHASIEHQLQQLAQYDYLINVEDDVLLPPETWQAVLAFDAQQPLDRCLLPNRLEEGEHGLFCVDLKAWPGWTERSLPFQGHELRVALNPHSGISILSSRKALYARGRIDLTPRRRMAGDLMASALAALHAPFALYRPYDDPTFAHVRHLDAWQPRTPESLLAVGRPAPPATA